MAHKRSTSKTEPKPRTLKRVRNAATGSPAEPMAPTMSEEEIARKAYFLWESRGRPLGSPEEDWEKAKEQLGV
jgi:hypothetical protein